MATIKERAQAYRKETEKSIFKSDMDISTMEFEYAYIQGATDQRKIDIDKATCLLVEMMEDEMARHLETWDEKCKQKTIDNLRKAMEE